MLKYKHSDAVDLVIQRLESFGLNVHSKKEKDIDIATDILVVFPEENKVMSIVVRAVSPAGHYTWISKDKFDINDEELYIAVVYNNPPKEPTVYLLPAISWERQAYPFLTRNYDKPDLVSPPEYGIDFNQKSMDTLTSFTLGNVLTKLGFTYQMDKKMKVGDVFIDDTPIDFSFVQTISDAEYDEWVKSGCPTPYDPKK